MLGEFELMRFGARWLHTTMSILIIEVYEHIIWSGDMSSNVLLSGL